MKNETITVPLTNGRSIEVDAIVDDNGKLAAHKTIRDGWLLSNNYTITHIATGGRVASNIWSLEKAKERLEWYMKLEFRGQPLWDLLPCELLVLHEAIIKDLPEAFSMRDEEYWQVHIKPEIEEYLACGKQ